MPAARNEMPGRDDVRLFDTEGRGADPGARVLVVVSDRDDLSAVAGGAYAVGLRPHIARGGGYGDPHIPQLVYLSHQTGILVKAFTVRGSHRDIDDIDAESAVVVYDPVNSGDDMRDHSLSAPVQDLDAYDAGGGRHAAVGSVAHTAAAGGNPCHVGTVPVVVIRYSSAVYSVIPAV